MKIMKKSLLALTILAMSSSMLPHYGYGGGGDFGGGFATGALLGTGLTLAATSGNRYQDPDTVTIKSINKDIERENKEIRKLHADLRKGRISQEEHDDRVAEHKENINSLQKQRVQVRA